MTRPVTLVTGAAGFIGSHLVERLLAAGTQVVGVDCLTPYYDGARKLGHLQGALRRSEFRLVEADLARADLAALLSGVDVIYHLAGQPGVRRSWGEDFAAYDRHNVRVTQRLLEAACAQGVSRLVYASSSSVYGNASASPVSEDAPTVPVSPYGVTKLAAEHLCRAYAAARGVPTVSLRYFTVYGPRQRPDMALHRLLAAACHGSPFPLYGDGEQTRDFTYVEDVVAATEAAARAPLQPGTVLNISGGSSASMTSLIRLVEQAVGRPVPVERRPGRPGDVRHTRADTGRARRLLGWRPRVGLEEGVRAHAEWYRRHQRELGGAAVSPALAPPRQRKSRGA